MHMREWREDKQGAGESMAGLGRWLTGNMAIPPKEGFDFFAHLNRQREWSAKTFGQGTRHKGVVDHIRKELKEIEAEPSDLTEWIDVVILALDGAWRSGSTPEQIIAALVAKQTKNEGRIWPDWRTMSEDAAICHLSNRMLQR